MVDLIDAVNFLEIQNTKGGNRNEARLRDLEGKAQYLAKKTGHEPVSWYEFTREVPPEKPSYLSNTAIGAGIGGLALAGISFATGGLTLLPVLSGVIVGGLLGGYHKTENTSRAQQVDAYEQYLNQFEAAQARGLSHEQTMDDVAAQLERIDNNQVGFVQNLESERKKEKKCCGKG